MPFPDLAARLDAGAPEPLALQLVRLLAREIRDGGMAPGAAMPSSRALAEELGISRHVAMSALRELEMEGWVLSRPGSGTYVSGTPPGELPRGWGALADPAAMPEDPPFELSSQLRPVSAMASTLLDLSDGFPDARLAPKEALARGYRRALQRHGDDLLGRGEPQGNPLLREQLALHLRDSRGLNVRAENLLITRGIPMALTLIAQALGGHAAVENPGQPQAWEALRAAGCSLHPVRADVGGLVPEALAELLAHQPIAFLHLSPRRHFPTTAPLSPERRARVMELARIHRFARVEDDPDGDLAWTAAALPLAAEDPEGRVIHLGSLSQVLAPGLGLGYLVAPSGLIDRLARVRQRLDLQGDHVLEWAVADVMRDGDLVRHLARSRKIYRERRDAFARALQAGLGPGFEVVPPGSGLACWVKTPPGLPLEPWCSRCLLAGVKLLPGSHFEFHGLPLQGLRLGFGHLEEAEAHKALAILVRNGVAP